MTRHGTPRRCFHSSYHKRRDPCEQYNRVATIDRKSQRIPSDVKRPSNVPENPTGEIAR